MIDSPNSSKDQKTIIWDILFGVCFVLEQVVPHQTAAQIALVAFCGYSFLMIIITNLDALKVSFLFPMFLLFIIICYLGIVYGDPINYEGSRSMLVTLLIDSVFLLQLYIYIRYRGAEHFIDVFIAVVALSAILILIQSFSVNGSLDMRNVESGQHQNGVAILCAIALLLLFIKIRKYRLKAAPYFAIFAFFIVMSGTKKAIIAIVVGIFVIIYLRFPKKLLRNVIISIIALIALYLIVMKIPFVYNILGIRLEVLSDYLKGGEGDSSTLTRARFIELGIEYYKKYPIFGIGLDGFRNLKDVYSYSHSNYVELLCDTGLTGLITYYSMHFMLFISALWIYFKGNRKFAVYALVILLNVVILDFAMVSYYDRSNVIYLGLCAALLAEGANKRNVKYKSIC